MKYTYNLTPDYEYEAGLLIARHYNQELSNENFLREMEENKPNNYAIFMKKFGPLVELEQLIFSKYSVSKEDYDKFFAYFTLSGICERASIFDLLHDLTVFAKAENVSLTDSEAMKKCFLSVLFEDRSFFNSKEVFSTDEFVKRLREKQYRSELNWNLLDIYDDVCVALAKFEALVKPVKDILVANADVFKIYLEDTSFRHDETFFDSNPSFNVLNKSEGAEIRYCFMGFNEISIIVRPPFSEKKPLLRYGIAVDDLYKLKMESSDDLIDAFTGKLKCLSDRTRLKILFLLKDKTLYGQELTDALGLSNATISHHMSILLMEGFIKVQRDRNMINYSLNTDNIGEFLQMVKEILA